MDYDPWVEYARLQSMLSRTTDAYKAAGIEAAMTDLLEKISNGEHCSPARIRNLVVNRTSKERRRRAMVHAGRQDLVHDRQSDNAADSRLILAEFERSCGSRDFLILVNQALGHSYKDMARHTGVNPNTLKIRAHRAREKVVPLAA